MRTVLRWREQAAARDKSRMKEAREQLDALAVAHQPATVAEILIVTGHPADDIAATAIQRKASLIAMGLGGDEGLFAPSPGSIAYRTLCLAPMPVLAVPALKDVSAARHRLRAATHRASRIRRARRPVLNSGNAPCLECISLVVWCLAGRAVYGGVEIGSLAGNVCPRALSSHVSRRRLRSGPRCCRSLVRRSTSDEWTSR
jgi:hypothetical protein